MANVAVLSSHAMALSLQPVAWCHSEFAKIEVRACRLSTPVHVCRGLPSAPFLGAVVGALHTSSRLRKVWWRRKSSLPHVSAFNGNEKDMRNTVCEQTGEDDNLLFKDMVLQQATQGRILSPWESLCFHLRTSRGFTASCGLVKRLRDVFRKTPFPLQTRQRVVTNSRDGEDDSLPRQHLASSEEESPCKVAMLGTRDCSLNHQREIEMLSEARVTNGEHIYTSGSVGTNAAVIKGALKAGKPELLTVILPQSISKQDTKSQNLLRACIDAGAQVHELSDDNLPLAEAARLCNSHILGHVDKLVCFVSFLPSESATYMSLISEAKEQSLTSTTFYLD